MPDVTAYVDDRQNSEFYPTPEKLVHRMLGKIKWDPVEAILEPSAGKGDILRGLATAAIRKTQLNRMSIDCIEIDPNLRAILKYSFSDEHKREILKRKESIIEARTRSEKKDWDTQRYLYYDEATREYKPCSEERPPFGKRVLGTTKAGQVVDVILCPTGCEWFRGGDYFPYNSIVAWMPLPQPFTLGSEANGCWISCAECANTKCKNRYVQEVKNNDD